jgi:glutathione peroxidase
MKYCFLILLLVLSAFSTAVQAKTIMPATIYEFKVTALNGKTIDLSKYKGRKILIVNTASQCGNTPQYAALEKLSVQYKDKLVIIGFPANNFGSQEPGTNEEIATFCQKNYQVTFPMAAKISVKGDDMAPIYHWLTEKKYNTFKDSEVTWNFQKYLINENGALVAVFDPSTKPDSPEIISAIKNK